MIDRRCLVIGGLGLPVAAYAGAAELVDVLRRGGVAVLMRHATTEPGVGDPDNFRLGDCSTQRNLSGAGREQSRRIGRWFADRRLRPARVLSSPWCRCVDTARLAFGEPQVWPALGSNFNRDDGSAQRTSEALDALVALRPGVFEIWITHQVNIAALAKVSPAMGHAVVVRGRRDGDGRSSFDNAGSLSFE